MPHFLRNERNATNATNATVTKATNPNKESFASYATKYSNVTNWMEYMSTGDVVLNIVGQLSNLSVLRKWLNGSYTPRYIYEEAIPIYNWYFYLNPQNISHSKCINTDNAKEHKHLIIQMIDDLLSTDPANGITLQSLGFNDAQDAYSQCKSVDPSFKYDFDALKCFRVVKGRHEFIVPELEKPAYFGYSYRSLNLSLSEYFLYIQSLDDKPERLITKFLNKTPDSSIKFSVEPFGDRAVPH